jgi:hypothetical protein
MSAGIAIDDVTEAGPAAQRIAENPEVPRSGAGCLHRTGVDELPGIGASPAHLV